MSKEFPVALIESEMGIGKKYPKSSTDEKLFELRRFINSNEMKLMAKYDVDKIVLSDSTSAEMEMNIICCVDDEEKINKLSNSERVSGLPSSILENCEDCCR